MKLCRLREKQDDIILSLARVSGADFAALLASPCKAG